MKDMKKILFGWNGCYGCQRFEVDIPYGCSIEEVMENSKKENPTYQYFIEEIPENMSVYEYIEYLYRPSLLEEER
jgi:hypothetical protein